MQSNSILLSLLIWLPIIGGAVVSLVGGDNANRARWLALVVSILVFVVSIPLFTGYDASTATMQFDEFHMDWRSTRTITRRRRYLDRTDPVDHIHDRACDSRCVGFGTTRSTSTWPLPRSRRPMIGVFCALDALLFYVFFEGMLIPMFIIIGIWGGPRRVYATLKFFLYTFFGSIFMLVGLVWLYMHAHSWELSKLAELKISASAQAWLFFAFLLGFAIKVPMWPVHTWLPDAHVEAPTGGSVILAAIMLKIGGTILRFAADRARRVPQYAWLVIALSLVAVIYVGFAALAGGHEEAYYSPYRKGLRSARL